MVGGRSPAVAPPPTHAQRKRPAGEVIDLVDSSEDDHTDGRLRAVGSRGAAVGGRPAAAGGGSSAAAGGSSAAAVRGSSPPAVGRSHEADTREQALARFSQLPRVLASQEQELLGGLDGEQRLGVCGSTHGANMAIVGPPGFGKSHGMGKAIKAMVRNKAATSLVPSLSCAVAGVGPTHTSRRAQQLQVERVGLSADVQTSTLAAGGIWVEMVMGLG